MRPILVHAVPIGIGHYNFSRSTEPFSTISPSGRNEALPQNSIAIAARRGFMADTICHGDVTTVRDRVAPLDGFPRRVLCSAEFFLFRWMPAMAVG